MSLQITLMEVERERQRESKGHEENSMWICDTIQGIGIAYIYTKQRQREEKRIWYNTEGKRER
jgi:hypothetical protein